MEGAGCVGNRRGIPQAIDYESQTRSQESEEVEVIEAQHIVVNDDNNQDIKD